MQTLPIQYSFVLPDGSKEVFDLEIDAKTIELVSHIQRDLPAWTDLSFHQCPHCPLSAKTHTRCPLSTSIAGIVERFENILSYDTIQIEVTTDKRSVSQSTTAQEGISSLLGLVIATSGCPHTAFFKPMARFHLPLASVEETIYRATSMYLLAQYFVKIEGRKPDFEFEGLSDLYKNIQTINVTIAKRVRSAGDAGPTVNAIVLLDVFAQTLTSVIEESLQDMRYLFEPYFKT